MADKNSETLERLKAEVDALQIEIMKEKPKWHKSPPVIISALALLFSFGTTSVSFQKESREDIRSARIELRTILQRISRLPKENYEILTKYKDDPQGQALSGVLNQENSLLARQASEIVDRFPEAISASEYLSVASALMMASDPEKLSSYYELAISKTSDPNTKVTALRQYGAYLISAGQVIEGRKKYELALNIWQEYVGQSSYFKGSTDALTEMYWAQAEMSVNNIEDARNHIRKASDHANNLPPGPITQQLMGQIVYTRGIIEQGRTTSLLPIEN